MSNIAAHRLTTPPDALTKLLAPSEAEIMCLLWQHGPMTIKPVHLRIAAQRDVAYTTILRTMERLVDKGLVQRGSRQDLGGAYIYTPAASEQAFVAERLADILGAVERDYPTALAQYLGSRRPPR